MSKKTIILIILIIALPVFLYFLLPSDESKIKKLFKQGALAVEKEDIDEVMSKVSYNYRDEYGFTYLYIKESLKNVFQRFNDIKIEYENLRINIRKNQASAEMDVRIIGSSGENTGYLIGDVSTPVRLTFNLEKERGKWLLTKTEGLPFNLQ